MIPSETSAPPGTATSYIFPFGPGLNVPSLDLKLLGAKGLHLAEMSSLGLPVPPGFIITSNACVYYLEKNKTLPSELERQLVAAVQTLENQTHKQFGNSENPLLISVRSGAAISMPGMLDTILNLGLNDQTVQGFAKAMNNERLAYDCYRRFIMMYSTIVYGFPHDIFTGIFNTLKEKYHVQDDNDLTTEAFKELTKSYQETFQRERNSPFPQDVHQQLIEAIKAVFASWNNERSALYRQINHVPNDLATAATVQAMVFGNRNQRSAAGVCFSRNPSNGNRELFGEFLLESQGEDVANGTRPPQPINNKQQSSVQSKSKSLEELMPENYRMLEEIAHTLEKYYHDMQDIEFTIDNGELFLLQTRSAKRTGLASIKVAVDMHHEGLIDEKTVLRRIEPGQIEQLLAPVFHPSDRECAQSRLMGKGLNACPGAACGMIALSSQKAIELNRQGHPCILVRKETNPNDFPGIVAAQGILTLHGSSTSHAAVVARGMGKPCVVGCNTLNIDVEHQTISSNGVTLKEEEFISIDATTGEVFGCILESSPAEILQVLLTKELSPEASELYQYYRKVMSLADKYRRMKVRSNTDTPHDAVISLALGAEGIGLCRTEHTFFDSKNLSDVRKMLFSPNNEERETAAKTLFHQQKDDIKRILRTMNGLPVTIRLLDPPLHAFLPENEDELNELASQLNTTLAKLKSQANALRESNPMLGHRGCRLGILHPTLTKMQTQAIFEAAAEATMEGFHIQLEIMVPLVAIKEEMTHQKLLIQKVAKEISQRIGVCVMYNLGAMIELPRSAFIADKIAEESDFFSFGTSDLTQTTFGMSRKDSDRFIPMYTHAIPNPAIPNEKMVLLQDDPFQTLDREAVVPLMQMAIEKGRKTRAKLKCGVCGDHSGDPRSITVCHQIGIDYLSCSPYRLPVARLAAARAAVGA